MKPYFLIANIIAIFVPMGVAWICSNDRKKVKWKNISIIIAIEISLCAFFIYVPAGKAIVEWTADAFTKLINVSFSGVEFVFSDWVKPNGNMMFIASVLLPILFIVPFFDILTYIGVLPFVIKWIGRAISFVTRNPKFESFFAVEMMFLGNTEAIAISRTQLNKISARRNLTIAMMSMSCLQAALIGAYCKMMPAQFIIIALPLNVFSAIIVTNILNPVFLESKDDTVIGVKDSKENKKPPFFSYLSTSVLTAGKLILIIVAFLVAFVSLITFINKFLGLSAHFGIHWLTLENIFGVLLFPFSFIMGFNVHDAFFFAQQMGLKLVTNEFVVMSDMTNVVKTFTPHLQACLTVFLTSFANFSTLGMVIGAFKVSSTDETNDLIQKNISRIFLSGLLVSLVSAAVIGLFVW